MLAAVGPRLRALRQRRGTTLAQLAELTGISVSTLSRLESGGRKPTLELLLPAGQGLPGAARRAGRRARHRRPAGRTRARSSAHGMTFLPLTRRPGGVQAFKQIFPPRPAAGDPELKTHEGYEWLYVLSGRVRLLLGDHDLMLTAGEVAEFDTRIPHRFANPGPGTAEILNLFGPQGERLHVRARPAAPDKQQ